MATSFSILYFHTTNPVEFMVTDARAQELNDLTVPYFYLQDATIQQDHPRYLPDTSQHHG